MTKQLNLFLLMLIMALLPVALQSQVSVDYGYFMTPKWSTFIYDDNDVEDAKNTFSYSVGG